MAFDAFEARAFAKMDDVAYRHTNKMRIALVAVDPTISQICRTYVDDIDNDNILATLHPDEASARTWIKTSLAG